MPANRFNGFTDYGVGIGLRVPHYEHILAHKPVVDWFEIISENYMVDGGKPLKLLDQILDQYQVVQHGVSMYFGSVQPADQEHLRRLKQLTRRTRTPWLSDHLCWGSVDGRYTHDLLPLPYTFEAVRATAARIREVQDYLEIPVAVENVSSYAEFHESEMTEWEFLNEVVHSADCGILLDVNNIYVSSQNHTFDPMDYVNAVAADRVAQIHVAGHSRFEKYILDTHDHPVLDPVWKLYARAIERIGPTATLLEWDDNIPSFDEVHGEALKANRYLAAGGGGMSLLELQRRMAADVTRPLTPDFKMQPESRGTADSYIKPNDRLSSFDRLEIYNRQYWFRVIAAVSEDFSALQAVLGVRKFEDIVLAYLREHPSTSFTLRNLGAKLPQWLAAHPEYSSQRHQLAVDVAQVEWAYIEAFDGAAVAPLGPENFAHLGSDSTLLLQPHLQLLELSYPADELVLAVHQQSNTVDKLSNAVAERQAPKRSRLRSARRAATWLAVHRFADVVYYRRLEKEAYLLLSSLRRGSTLAEAVVLAFANSKLSGEQQARKIQSYFAHAAELGWFCG